MKPPHLPPPACNIENHRKWLRLKLIAASTVFGLAAGMSGAAVMLGWLWPNYGGGDVWITAQTRQATAHNQLEEQVRAEVAEKIFTVYRGLSAAGGVSFLSQSEELGEAVSVSSDGWTAMVLPVATGDWRNWRFLGANKALYRAEKSLFDARAGIAYVKLAPIDPNKENSTQSFKVIGFADKVGNLDEVYVFQNGEWRYAWITETVWKNNQSGHLDSAPAFGFNTSVAFAPGSVAVNSRGQLAGIINASGQLEPAQAVARVVPDVLSDSRIVYATLGVEGWFSEEQSLIVDGEKISGFAVMRVVGAKTLLRRGDIILEINGEVVSAQNLWYNIYNNQKVRLKVLRSGKPVELETPVIKI